MISSSLTVNPGVELAYLDSGAPGASLYTTIFAIHGMCFNNHVFMRLQAVAFTEGFRFVAINRRPFPGSTPFSKEEMDLITNVDDDATKRSEFIEARAHEMASFIDIFAQTFNLPSTSENGKRGGSIVLGWSMGTHLATAVFAYSATLPPDIRSRLASQLRSVVIYETSPGVMGLPEPPKNWTPMSDTTVPEELRLPMLGQYVSAYFDNGDYNKRDLDTLQYVLPAIDKPPTIYSMTPAEQKDILVFGRDASFDFPLLLFFQEQLRTTFRQAFGSAETAALFPNLQKTFIVCDRSPWIGFAGMWAVQDELKKLGMGADINYEIVKGANHFMHWESPDEFLELIRY